MGQYQEIHFYNKDHTEGYDHRVLSYVRWNDNEKLIILSNFDDHNHYSFDFKVPPDLISQWQLTDGEYPLTEELYGEVKKNLSVNNGQGQIQVELEPLQSYIFKVRN